MERERVRVLQGGTGGDVLVLHDLRKSHRGLCRRSAAVRGVSVGVARGEVTRFRLHPRSWRAAWLSLSCCSQAA